MWPSSCVTPAGASTSLTSRISEMTTHTHTRARARRHLCRQGVALASTRQLRSQGPVSVQAHRTEVVTGSEGQEGANGSGAGLESGAGTETVTGSGVGTGT